MSVNLKQKMCFFTRICTMSKTSGMILTKKCIHKQKSHIHTCPVNIKRSHESMTISSDSMTRKYSWCYFFGRFDLHLRTICRFYYLCIYKFSIFFIYVYGSNCWLFFFVLKQIQIASDCQGWYKYLQTDASWFCC